MAVATERNKTGGDERRVVDGRSVANLEAAEQPPSRHPGVAVRFSFCDQDRELEQFGTAGSAELAQRGFCDRKVSPLDRSVEDGPRMALSARGAFPGPDGRASLTLSATWSP